MSAPKRLRILVPVLAVPALAAAAAVASVGTAQAAPAHPAPGARIAHTTWAHPHHAHLLPEHLLPLHAQPGDASPIIGRLAKGDRFTTHQNRGGWTQITDRTTRAEGWAHFTHPHHTTSRVVLGHGRVMGR